MVSLMSLYVAIEQARHAVDRARAAVTAAHDASPDAYPHFPGLDAVRGAAYQAEADATRALARALYDATWGAQPDGSFVTRRRDWDGHFATALHAPARRGCLALTISGESVDISARSEAMARANVQRDARRADVQALDANRRRIDHAVRVGAALWYEPGQEGGIVRIDAGSQGASARGTCKRAGVDPATLPESRAGWVRIAEPQDRLSRLSPRVRRLPASDRRRAT